MIKKTAHTTAGKDSSIAHSAPVAVTHAGKRREKTVSAVQDMSDEAVAARVADAIRDLPF